MTVFPDSIDAWLSRRGWNDADARRRHLFPSLSDLPSPERYADLPAAVALLRRDIEAERPIGVYADRDMDGLAGLTVLVRSLRTLGAHVRYAVPQEGRGVERARIDELLSAGCRTLIFVDCGTNETTELERITATGVRVIVADHHRLRDKHAGALWIHPQGRTEDSVEAHPAGCVLAFTLARALWESFVGDDEARLDYFLFSHTDVVALGILADRVPLVGENRILVWHGLRRLARTSKAGLAALLRFFRLVPNRGVISVRDASWRLIPLLNAAGRMHRPLCAAELLLTEEPYVASSRIDQLLAFNSQRRAAQDASLAHFEALVAQQCDLDRDPALVILGENVEPTVSGLAAQALARQHQRPVFLFVQQGDVLVGSARGLTEEDDLFRCIAAQEDLLVKFGGHAGAVGMTLRAEHWSLFRQRVLAFLPSRGAPTRAEPELRVRFEEIGENWWDAWVHLEPFGPGFESPLFELSGVQRVWSGRRRQICTLQAGGADTVLARLEAAPRKQPPYQWIVQEESPAHALIN